MSNHVTLIAVAKDEDCYIHEWIYHHLYMGFDSILIGINRTTDKTEIILDKINEEHKNCSYENIDWMDKIPPFGKNERIQTLAYSYLSEVAIEKYSPTHIMYLDIDEFWFSMDFSKISRLLEKISNFDVMSFNWLCQMGEEDVFAPPFKYNYASLNNHVKSLIKSDCLHKVDYFRCHTPMITSSYLHLDADGRDFNVLVNKNEPSQFSSRAPSSKNKYYVLHRMIRSEYEYLASLFRGNPEGEYIKGNRNGFRVGIGDEWNISAPNEYYSGLGRFVSDCGLVEILQKSRDSRLSLFKKIESLDISILSKDFKKFNKALKGTFLHQTFIYRIIEESQDVDTLRDLALLIEDINLQILLMERAHQLRPEGIFIKKKYMEYEKKILSLK